MPVTKTATTNASGTVASDSSVVLAIKRGQQKGLYTPFRALGYVTADVQVSFQARGHTYFITSSIGDSFQIFDGDKMGLLFVGPKLEAPITSIASFKDLTFAAVGSDIVIFHRSKEVHRLTDTNINSTLSNLLVLGDLIFSLWFDNTIRIWDFKTKEFVNEISLSKNFTATNILHPSTYLNKVLLGSQQGTMQLWNVRSVKLIYEFGSFGSPISILAQSPSIDVIAIGLLDGSIILHNIKVDKEVLRFKQDGKVTAITFRTDGPPIMATANMYGDIALWDLDERHIVHVMKGVHDAAIHSCMFYNGMPILVTASSDNSIKQWIFDSLDGIPRLLRLRSGHHKPPTMIRHYGDEGHTIISAGQDQAMRSFSIIRDSQNVELSQGSLEKKAKKNNVHIDALKLPQIGQFSANPAKEKQWDNIISCHAHQTVARTWHFQRKAIGKHQFCSKDGSAIKAVAISGCGDFGFIGTSHGRIDKFNMQSGHHRTAYTGGDNGHTKAITVIAPDHIGRFIYTASLDKTVKFWSFSKGTLVHTMQFDSPVSHMVLHSQSGLLVVATDHMGIFVIDVDTKKIVREFWGHMNRITDIIISADGRWIVSSSLDSTIRTWDLPTGYLIDGFRVSDIPTSISLSPTGDFLATTHVNHVGIFLWANRSQYENVPIRRMDDEDLFSSPASLPASSGNVAEIDYSKDNMDSGHNDVESKDATMDMAQNPADGMISLSLLPKSRWQNLLNLEAIKKRNQPIHPPKAPERAPFFLPTIAGANPHFNIEEAKGDENVSRVFKNMAVDINPLSQLLTSCHGHSNYSAVMEYFKGLSPSAIDIELRTLPLDSEHTYLIYFLKFVEYQLETHGDFELVQTYLNVFLKIHGDVLMLGGQDTQDALLQVQQSINQLWARLENKLQYSLCVVDFTRGVAM
ncbi:hypothetical protein BASA50_002429 [Batrachochytrium salamandrivorans]|uniref:Small-subunit processome Utp21 domain-containing protein n=1 Tax=Batrachochytrium salamandrivorans TaxID=1357716 RepID=A0ABQ8FP59_9FUNG|nr:hypothetical protein BASA60_006365 [Batrachochytrium salamandrivorans]KAH6584007.1 hypothetical protein BASA61_007769 [Batrachochytrium salamandrivorans]KAH6600254.1 hypothetical protein BASA50_002429 [Batrachochytrium salamandrivorans]KAH9269897.1 hypothetical protein BASA83_008052 [Batrachochytrium salamandrivorans]